MNPASLARPYYPALDGIRGIAILLVICCHNFNFIPYLEFGWIGVDLFFVLSGFLITDILLRVRESKRFLQHFYIRRMLRIFPLYYGVVLIFFILTPLVSGLQYQYNYYHTNEGLTWFHMQNFLYVLHEKPSDFLLLNHFWSLSVEEQFYLIWPFVVFACRSYKKLVVIALALLACCILFRFSSWLYFGNGYTNFYFQYMTRIDGLCIGSVIAIWKLSPDSRVKRKMLFLSSCLLGMHLLVFILSRTFIQGLPHFNFLGYSSISVLFGILLLMAIESKGGTISIILGNSWLRFTGKISYSLYVFHWPLLILSKLYLLHYLTDAGYGTYSSLAIVSVTALLAAVIISIGSYHFFEKKLLALKDVLTTEGFLAKVRHKIFLLLNARTTR